MEKLSFLNSGHCKVHHGDTGGTAVLGSTRQSADAPGRASCSREQRSSQTSRVQLRAVQEPASKVLLAKGRATETKGKHNKAKL